MEKVKCKECGKEINKKAEICPNCGCRVKSNTFKYILICLVTIAVLIAGYYGVKTIKHKIHDNKSKEQIKNETAKKEELKKEEEKIIESYLGSYNISYNSDLFTNEHPYYKLKNSISLNEKCYYKELEIRHDGDIVKDCLSIRNAKTVDEYYLLDVYNLYLNDKSNIFYTTFRNFTESFSTPDASNESLKEADLLGQYICFDGTLDELKQIDCPHEITNQETIYSKYQFKLTKTK